MRRNVFTTYDPNLPSGKKFVAVHVQNEDPLYFLVEVKSKVCELFAQINKFLNLLEPELFGLAIRCADSFIFLDPLEKLSKYAPKQWRTQNNGMDNDGLPLFNVFFRVQFYVDSYLFISDKVAKLLYYHQMRENVLNYDQSISEERVFLLASYALQADYGNYNGQLHKEHYFQPNHYFPKWVIEELGVAYIVRHLPALHCDHKGMSKSEAQSMYIKEASDPIAPHNFHFYQLTCKKGVHSTEVWLAITVSGIAVYAAEASMLPTSTTTTPTVTANNTQTSPKSRLKHRISFFPWSDIGKLSFEKKKFEIRSTGNQGRKFMYYATSEEIARHLLWFARACHQFYLMVQPKIKEMLKREAEINRKKYRENCISSTSSSHSSSGNSSGGSSTGNGSNNTSKSVSPFEYSSTSSASGSSADHHKKSTSDLDMLSNSSVCGEDTDHNHHHRLRLTDPCDQRVSVISNASSNTTSGIVSDKALHGLEDSDHDDDDDADSDIVMGLNHNLHHQFQAHHRHHHHHHLHHGVNRAITLSGCSPQPVVSLESLALSEPIDHQSCRITDTVSKMNLTSNKKHSVSISNIMITSSSSSSSAASAPAPVSTAMSARTENSVETLSNASSSPICANQATSVSSYSPTSEVCVSSNSTNCSSKVLCLNINEPSSTESNCCSLSAYDRMYTDDESSCDGTDSVFDNTSKSYTSGKSNVTVLSTILKPEAERLLKQGYEADDAELMIDDGIDSIELAELKEFEQAEKEKIILNSLINKLPPPPPLSSSDSDSSSDDEDDRIRHRSCYSPLTQEKMHQRMRSSPRGSASAQAAFTKAAPNARFTPPKPHFGRPTTTTNSAVQCRSVQSNQSHIYENLKCGAMPRSSLQVDALVTPVKSAPLSTALPPPVPLRQCPSLNAFPMAPTPTFTTPHRTGMRIGVSSLTRPYTNRTKHSLLTGGGCFNPHHHHQNGAALSVGACCRSLFDTSTLSAGSEPNLYFESCNTGWPACAIAGDTARDLTSNKSDSVVDRRSPSKVPYPVVTGATLTTAFDPNAQQPLNHSTPNPRAHLATTTGTNGLSVHSQQGHNNNSNLEKVVPAQNSSLNLTSSAASHKPNQQAERTNLRPKSKEGSISDLHQLRQRSSDLNLPLITALFNDSSLMDQLKANEHNHESMSQSLQQIPQKMGPRSHTAHHSSGASVERTSTFRVDEAIAKSTLRQQQQQHDNNNNQPDYGTANHGIHHNHSMNLHGTRPTSWHLDHSCSGHNRLVASGGGAQATQAFYTGRPTDQTTQKLFNSDFVERHWPEQPLTT